MTHFYEHTLEDLKNYNEMPWYLPGRFDLSFKVGIGVIF